MLKEFFRQEFVRQEDQFPPFFQLGLYEKIESWDLLKLQCSVGMWLLDRY